MGNWSISTQCVTVTVEENFGEHLTNFCCCHFKKLAESNINCCFCHYAVLTNLLASTFSVAQCLMLAAFLSPSAYSTLWPVYLPFWSALFFLCCYRSLYFNLVCSFIKSFLQPDFFSFLDFLSSSEVSSLVFQPWIFCTFVRYFFNIVLQSSIVSLSCRSASRYCSLCSIKIN